MAVLLECAAQEAQTYDRLHLRTGRQIYGQLVDWDYNGELTFRDTSGLVNTYARADYRRLTYGNSGLRPVMPSNDVIEHYEAPSSWYQSVALGFNFGRTSEDNDFGFFPTNEAIVGYQIALQFGRYFGPRFQLGALALYSSYTHSRRERTVGAGLQARYLLTQPVKFPILFLQMESAYELPIGSDNQSIDEVKGGIAIQPSIGILLGGRQAYSEGLSLDVGYRFLETTYRTQSFRGSELRTPKYKRLVLRAAYQF